MRNLGAGAAHGNHDWRGAAGALKIELMKWTPADNKLIAVMPDAVRAALEPELTLESLPQGRIVFEPDQPITRICFPVTGVLSVLTVLKAGSAIETSTIGCEGAAGLSSAVAPIRSSGRMIAQTPATVFSTSSEVLGALAADSAPLRALIVRYGELVLAQTQQSTACNIAHDVQERFCRWLLTCDDRQQGSRVELTQEFLAMMLGVQRTTVSQVASQLQTDGVIRYNRGRIDILDRPQLERRSCECYDVIRRRIDAFLASGERPRARVAPIKTAAAS